MNILVINAGSSSVKFGLFRWADLQPFVRGTLDWGGTDRQAVVTLKPADAPEIRREVDAPDYRSAVLASMKMLRHCDAEIGDDGRNVRAVGHRLINGGPQIRRPVPIDDEIKQIAASFTHLAPLHVPAGLEAVAATEQAFPHAAQVGVFDTAFFGDIPPADFVYPVPYEWYEEWGIRRFGYHGTSHAYCAGRAAELLARCVKGRPPSPTASLPSSPSAAEARPVSPGHNAADLRLVICHLGQGASAAAVRGGTALANTMGYTSLEGLMMGTRSGTVDPGMLLHVARARGLSVEQLDDVLHRKSGLLGVSGVSSDFRQVESAAAQGNSRAQLALDIYTYRVRSTIGSLAVNMGGMDALVFTGGIGENSSRLRREVCQGLDCLGVEIDTVRNDACSPDTDIGTDHALTRTLVIHTREDYMIARAAKKIAS